MLTDAQIAIPCDIGQASSFDEEKKGEVLSLVVRGYVERDGDLFKITPQGEKVLTDRPAGLTNYRTEGRSNYPSLSPASRQRIWVPLPPFPWR